MATCKFCDKSGWLVGVDCFGLCDGCHAVHSATIIENCRLFTSSVSVAVKSTNPSTTLTRLSVARMCCEALEEYEEKAIPTIGMRLDDAKEMISTSFDLAVAEAVRLAFDSARQKAATASSDAGRLGAYSSAAARLSKLASEFPSVAAFSDCAHDLQAEQDALRFELLLRKSAVAEAKGQKKKALDYAIEAFMGLRHDATPDEIQSDLASKAVSRIEALGGTAPSFS